MLGLGGNISTETIVYLVDDNPQNLELLGEYLEDLGCRVEMFPGGAEALSAINGARPDVVILDVMMPRMSGFQVCERLKASEATRDVPVIMVTALNESADVERGLESGADDFLIKPVQRAELLMRVGAQIAVRAMGAVVRDRIRELRTLA